MGLTIWRFLEYFSVEELKFVLSVINEPQTGNRQELIERVIMEWSAHNKKWEQLISYLDVPTLRRICNDYDLGHTGARDLLAKRIKKQITTTKPISSKSSSDKKQYEQVNKKTHSYVMPLLILWVVFGIVVAVLNLGGVFVPMHEQPLQISKEYFAYFETSNNSYLEKTIATGSVGNTKLKGQIIFKSTLFSAQNPIDVFVNLQPDTEQDPDAAKILDVLPEPFFVFFVNADNFENGKNNKSNLAMINLTKSAQSLELSGSGKIIYNQGGKHPVYIVDPRESNLLSTIIQEQTSKNISLTYTLPEQRTNNTVLFNNDGTTTIQLPNFSQLNSETIPYYIEIKQSDALNSLETDKITGFGTWLAIAFAPLGIVTLLKRKH